jgi:uncharacterized protein
MYATQNEAYNQGLRNYMIGIYNTMLLGLLVSAGAAYFSVASGFTDVMKAHSWLYLIVALSPLALIFVIGSAMRKSPLSTVKMWYWVFVALEGIGLSVMLSKYSGESIFTAFLVSAAGFAGCSLYGYTTKRDLGPIGTVAVFMLIGLLALMIVNIFIPSSGFTILICLAGLVIFALLTAWDTQKLKEAYNPSLSGDELGRITVWGALDLYLDFLNIFLFVLRLIGVAPNDD